MNEREAREWWEEEQRLVAFRLRHPVLAVLRESAAFVLPLLALTVLMALWLLTA